MSKEVPRDLSELPLSQPRYLGKDTARIEAEVDQTAAGELRLRLRLTQEIKEERYRVANVPFVCPDAR